ncbi:MAG: hypothetical protein HQK77_04935 [Desulfobacterales bacterium]|nr:hypothetical protein [Desulfobacterales bacterium]
MKKGLKSTANNKQIIDLPPIPSKTESIFSKSNLKKPGIQAYLQYQIRKIIYGWVEQDQYPEKTAQKAIAIMQLLNSQLNQVNRIAIDGVPGSGKSSLSLILSSMMGLDVVCLDHQQNIDQPIEVKDNTIYEHYRLLRTQHLDLFDALIYIDEPIEISKAKILERKKGAYLIDIINYELLKKIGEKAFYSANGDVLSIPDSFIKIKLKPDHGFNDLEKINKELIQMNLHRPGLNKEQQLFLCVTGKRKKGFTAYINSKAYKQDMFETLKTALFS